MSLADSLRPASVIWVATKLSAITFFKSFNQRGRIPTAVSFKGAKILARQQPKNKNKHVMAYCGGPTSNAYKRGSSAAEALGFKNAKHLSAGISGWIKAGKKLEKN